MNVAAAAKVSEMKNKAVEELIQAGQLSPASAGGEWEIAAWAADSFYLGTRLGIPMDRGVSFFNDVTHGSTNAEKQIARASMSDGVLPQLEPAPTLSMAISTLQRKLAARAGVVREELAGTAAGGADEGLSDGEDEEVEGVAEGEGELACIPGGDSDSDGEDERLLLDELPHVREGTNVRQMLMCVARLFARNPTLPYLVQQHGGSLRGMPGEVGHRLKILPDIATLLHENWDAVVAALKSWLNALSGNGRVLKGGTQSQVLKHTGEVLSFMLAPFFRLAVGVFAALKQAGEHAYTAPNMQSGLLMHR